MKYIFRCFYLKKSNFKSEGGKIYEKAFFKFDPGFMYGFDSLWKRR